MLTCGKLSTPGAILALKEHIPSFLLPFGNDGLVGALPKWGPPLPGHPSSPSHLGKGRAALDVLWRGQSGGGHWTPTATHHRPEN